MTNLINYINTDYTKNYLIHILVPDVYSVDFGDCTRLSVCELYLLLLVELYIPFHSYGPEMLRQVPHVCVCVCMNASECTVRNVLHNRGFVITHSLREVGGGVLQAAHAGRLGPKSCRVIRRSYTNASTLSQTQTVSRAVNYAFKR